MAEAEQLITSITTALTTITEDVGPAATDAIVFVYRLDAMKMLALGVILLLIAGAAIWVHRYSWSSFTKKMKERSAHDKTAKEDRQNNHSERAKELKDDSDINALFMVMSGIVAAFTGIGSLGYLLSPYYWMALFGNPGPMIAKRALEAANML
jgi:hypothetical protein